MVHICFAIHDEKGTYIKNLAVAICSVLENTKTKIVIHLLHDKTLCEENKRKLKDFVNKYGTQINFYEVNVTRFDDYKVMTGSFTIGSLFRIEIAQLLPYSVNKVIYLDADVIVNIDINDLWKMDIDNYMVAGCLDRAIYIYQNTWSCLNGVVDVSEYINSGVMVLNIKKIREKVSLEDEFFRFIKKYPNCQCIDQDALNYIFYREKLIINEKYNIFVNFYQNKTVQQGIYHFAGDKVNLEDPKPVDEMFLGYLIKTPWGRDVDVFEIYENIILNKHRQIKFYQNAIKLIQQKEKKIIWGAKSVMLPRIRKLIKFDRKKDYIIDSDDRIVGTDIAGLPVYTPKNILQEKDNDVLIIVLSRKFYNDISNKLTKYGFRENYDYIDGRMFLLQRQGGYIAHDYIDYV